MVYIVVVNVFDINRKAMKMCKLLSNVRVLRDMTGVEYGRSLKSLIFRDVQEAHV
jgi:hypothetical protein